MAVSKGLVLGAANVLFVALGFTLLEPASQSECGCDHRWDLFWAVAIVGMVPGLLVGGVAGYYARTVRAYRRVVVAGVGLAAVLVMGLFVGMPIELVALACIPTTIAALILERWTRPVEDPPPLPVASAQRS